MAVHDRSEGEGRIWVAGDSWAEVGEGPLQGKQGTLRNWKASGGSSCEKTQKLMECLAKGMCRSLGRRVPVLQGWDLAVWPRAKLWRYLEYILCTYSAVWSFGSCRVMGYLFCYITQEAVSVLAFVWAFFSFTWEKIATWSCHSGLRGLHI